MDAFGWLAIIEDQLVPYMRDNGSPDINRSTIYQTPVERVFIELLKMHIDMEADEEEHKIWEKEMDAKNNSKP